MNSSTAYLLPLLVLVVGGGASEQSNERLQRHRNAGRAFYESAGGSLRAVEEFQQAVRLAPNSLPDRLNLGLALIRAARLEEGAAQLERVQKADPAIPHTWFNLGLLFRKQGRVADAIRQLEQFTTLVPSDAIARHNLGILYSRANRQQEALAAFQAAHRLDDKLVAPLFQIYTQHRLAGRDDEAAVALAAFRQAKQRQEQLGESEDVEWNEYAETYEVIDATSAPPYVPSPVFADVPLAGRLEGGNPRLRVADVDGDGRPDLIGWSESGIRIYNRARTVLETTGLKSLRGVADVAAGDFDNDGLADLCVAARDGAIVYRNEKGLFRALAAKLPAEPFAQVLWIDYDHDNDLDLLLLGGRAALFRNNGEGGFDDRSSEFPFAAGRPRSAAIIRAVTDTKGLDIAVSYEERPAVLYRDRLRGRFEATTLDAIPAGADSLVALDANNDAWMDVAFTAGASTGVVLNRRGAFRELASLTAGGGALVAVDIDNRGRLDLISGGTLFRNEGAGKFRQARTPAALARSSAGATADFDGDGRPDVAKVSEDGSVHLLLNRTATKNAWVSISLAGVKTTKLADSAEVEVKAGSMYQKLMYHGSPVHFGLAAKQQIDTVRITWPHGMIQNEVRQPVRRPLAYKEAPRLSGSCPMVFTWNGREFQFITDVLGVAPLGASSGDGDFFPVDHDEYVQIPEGALVANADGLLEVRMTEELREVAYLDQVRLIAVDHPADIEVFTNDKFKAPPFPEFRLFGVSDRVYPVRATDDHGHNVLPELLAKDRRYPDDFERDHSGVAARHSVELDFGAAAARDGRAVLVLHGWTDWADGSTFLRASQRPSGGLELPRLQVEDASGTWQTVLVDMGIPAGKPKTIVVDLTGKFLSTSRRVRILTNLCIYWDEIFLTDAFGDAAARLTPLEAQHATLEFRGFSRPLIHPERKQPEAFDYSVVSPASAWNPTPGLYTRYGDVAELLTSVDDRFVIMGSGDEVRLLFNPASLPPLAAGWKRQFLLLVDGWAKDGDANTAFGDGVEPLPFHSMDGYPYPAGQSYPADDPHNSYRRKYNTRPARNLIPQLH